MLVTLGDLFTGSSVSDTIWGVAIGEPCHSGRQRLPVRNGGAGRFLVFLCDRTLGMSLCKSDSTCFGSTRRACARFGLGSLLVLLLALSFGHDETGRCDERRFREPRLLAIRLSVHLPCACH